jgi:hypothetical protein
MATSARGREENAPPGFAIICGAPSSCAEQIIRRKPPADASLFSHGVKRTDSLHVENLLDRSVTEGRLPQGCIQKAAPVVRGAGGARRLASASLLGKARRRLD